MHEDVTRLRADHINVLRRREQERPMHQMASGTHRVLLAESQTIRHRLVASKRAWLVEYTLSQVRIASKTSVE
eukprot:11156404-Lingulodinium_polyedra.AAC.1